VTPGGPVGRVQCATWLAVNLWVLPLYGLLVGATLLAVSLALRASEFAFARRLGTVSAALGSILCVLSPFSGFEPDQLALVAVATIGVATIGVLGLLLVALVRLGVLLRQTRVRS